MPLLSDPGLQPPTFCSIGTVLGVEIEGRVRLGLGDAASTHRATALMDSDRLADIGLALQDEENT